MSFCRIPSSSSEEGSVAPLTESDLSDSVSADSHTHSAGEEEPPTKRKRDKALKTAAERNRKSGRMKLVSLSLSPRSSVLQKVQPGETLVAQDVAVAKESSDENARNHLTGSEFDTVVKSSEEVEQHRPIDVESTRVENEDCRLGTAGTASELSLGCAAEKTDVMDKCESVSTAQQDSDATAGDEVNGKKECATENSIPAAKCLPDESCEESGSVKRTSCATDSSSVGASVHVNTGTEVANNTALNADSSEDKVADDEQSVHTESNGKQDDGCKSRDKTQCNDVTDVSKFNDEDKSGVKPADKLVSNGHVGKKPRGRPKKSSKKGRKKREHSNVANSASVTEVQETDYEPTKKLGRPSKKSKLAQLAAEGCDSLPQSEDDIPLIELRRSARANKGQRKLEQLVLEQPKKRNRAKDEEKERKQAEKEEKRRKRETELQEQAALKAKKVRNVLLSFDTFTHLFNGRLADDCRFPGCFNCSRSESLGISDILPIRCHLPTISCQALYGIQSTNPSHSITYFIFLYPPNNS